MPNTDKTILLPQLQRYDQKIKGWADGKLDQYYEIIRGWADNKFLTKADTPSLPPATATTLGGVKVGSGLSATDDGTLNVTDVGGSIAEATEKTSGVVYAKVNPRIPPKSLGKVYSLQNSGLHIESFNKGVIDTEHLANYAVTAGKVANGAIDAAKLADNAVTTNKIVDGAVTSNKLASGAVTADKIADGAITKAKLASDVGVGGDDVVTITFDGTTADKTWNEVDALYKAGKRLQVLSTEWGDEYILPLVSVMNNGNNLYNFSAHCMNDRRAEVNFWHDPSIPDSSHQKEIFSEISDYPAASKTSLGVVKVGDGLSITSDGTLKASGAGGGGSIFNLGALSKGTLLGIVSFDCGNFIMYLVSCSIEPTPSGSQICYNLHGTDLLISPKSTGTVHIVPPSPKSGFYSYTLTWFQPKSASAKAALATLLPVQDECEQMEVEVAKLEQDWIDNQDETVAVDGNGVPITIATKKTDLEKKKEELKKKKAELEKLREDYFSKLDDWRNEVQE